MVLDKRENGLTRKKILLGLDEIKTIQYPGDEAARLLNPLTKRQREIYGRRFVKGIFSIKVFSRNKIIEVMSKQQKRYLVLKLFMYL